MSRGVERRALDGFGVESSLNSNMTCYTLYTTECICLDFMFDVKKKNTKKTQQVSEICISGMAGAIPFKFGM